MYMYICTYMYIDISQIFIIILVSETLLNLTPINLKCCIHFPTLTIFEVSQFWLNVKKSKNYKGMLFFSHKMALSIFLIVCTRKNVIIENLKISNWCPQCGSNHDLIQIFGNNLIPLGLLWNYRNIFSTFKWGNLFYQIFNVQFSNFSLNSLKYVG